MNESVRLRDLLFRLSVSESWFKPGALLDCSAASSWSRCELVLASLDLRGRSLEEPTPLLRVSATTPLRDDDSGDEIGWSIWDTELLGVVGGLSPGVIGVAGCDSG